MKWSKYRKVLRDNPDIARWLRWHIGSPMLISAPLNYLPGAANMMLRSYVRDKLSHIVLRSSRDFDRINLDLGHVHRNNLETEPGRGRCGTRIYADFSVRFHIVGVEEPGSRLAHVDSRDYCDEREACLTINEVIESRKAWHQLYWAKLGNALCFDAVVKRTRVWEVNDHGDKLVSESLDIFRFPESYTFPGLDLPRVGMM